MTRRRDSPQRICLIFLVAALYLSSPALAASETTTQIAVDIYSDQGGHGSNNTMGTYTIGDTIKFYIYVNTNTTIEVAVITPGGSVWPRMAGPVNSGIIVDYFDTQYPTGQWAISVKAQTGKGVVLDIASFEVVDKQPYTCTRTISFNTSGSAGETRFTGKIIKIYIYPVGGIRSWDVRVNEVYFGPDIRNQTVHVQVLAVTCSTGSPRGYTDENMTLGDQVAVYGFLDGNSVSVNGSVYYYVVKLSTLCERGIPPHPETGAKQTELPLGPIVGTIALVVIILGLVGKKHLRVKSDCRIQTYEPSRFCLMLANPQNRE